MSTEAGCGTLLVRMEYSRFGVGSLPKDHFVMHSSSKLEMFAGAKKGSEQQEVGRFPKAIPALAHFPLEVQVHRRIVGTIVHAAIDNKQQAAKKRDHKK